MSLSKTPAMLLIAAATADVGVTEQPIGSNAGPRINQMLKRVGLGPGFYWCAAAVSEWLYQASQAGGFTIPLPLTADCDVLLAKAKKLGILKSSNPQAGDIFLVLKPGDDNDAFHTGVVVKNNLDGTIETIEGNSNLDGSNNGYEVAHKQGKKSRAITSRLRFVRWKDTVKSASIPWTLTVGGVNLSEIYTENDGSVWAAARAFVESLKGKDKAAHLAYNPHGNNLTLDSHDLPVRATLRAGKAYAPVCELADAFGGLVLPPDTAKKRITVTLATPPSTV